MARGVGPLGPVAGGAASFVIAALTLGTLGVVALWADGSAQLGPADWAALRFTAIQALLSAFFSVALAIPVARALARRRFPGRAILVTLLGAPFILPVIVAVLGLLAVFGRNGIVSQGLGLFGLEPLHIYGLHGVVLAHVFFNLPLATRLILQGWFSIPAERFRLAASLGLGPGAVFRLIEMPMLLRILPGAFLVIFLICTTSFAVALTLGGGPRGTTLELAIYQAFRFDFDLGKAALLSVIQCAICAVAAVAVWLVPLPPSAGGGMDRVVERWGIAGGTMRAADALWIALASLFLLTPLAMIVARGVPGLFDLGPNVWAAMGRSIAVAIASVVLTLALTLSLAMMALRPSRAWLAEALAALSIAVSPLVIGTGLFLALRPVADPITYALVVTALVNALMSLPFAYRGVSPALAAIEADYGRVADSLALTGWARLRWLILPRLRRPVSFAAGLSAALSVGDLGVIALFSDPARATLPMQLYGQMGSYRMEQAAGTALLLLILALAMFWLFDRGGRGHAPT